MHVPGCVGVAALPLSRRMRTRVQATASSLLDAEQSCVKPEWVRMLEEVQGEQGLAQS